MSVLTLPSPQAKQVLRPYQPLGAARTLFHTQEPEVLLSGPAGTGKSYACLQKVHLLCAKVPGLRALIARKTLSSLTASGLVTYRERVLRDDLDGVHFFGGNAEKPPHYIYPNSSVVVVGGMDKPTRVMSSEYDLVYVQEATDLREHEWEALTSRLRNGVLPYQQLIADCNPDTPTHWLKQRVDRGITRMLDSRHEDNPSITPEYMARLDALTGVRRLRLRLGIWAAAEGIIYEGWDRAVHLVDAFPIPSAWPRYWTVDFGYVHPFVWQAWAEDPDGRLYRYAEVYMTHRLVEDHARQIKALTKDTPKPRAIICDHDAEDRATFERHLGMPTIAAKKDVSPGIQAVAARLRAQGDGKPRLFFLRDARDERDVTLADGGLPTETEAEIEGYVWDTSAGRQKGEQPLKMSDHGCDALRYMVAHLDLRRPVAVGAVNLTRSSPWGHRASA